MGSINPDQLRKMIGQDAAREEVETMVVAARSRGVMPRHTALIGPGGCGKTALARTIAGLLDAPFKEVPAGDVKTKDDMREWLISLGENTVGFIDEFHDVSKAAVEQILFPAVSDGYVMARTQDGPKRRALPPFTLVVATTDAKFSPSTARRFKCITLDYYTVEDLTKIVAWTATEHPLGPFTIDTDAAAYLAQRSLGVAGIAQQRLDDVIDQTPDNRITLAHAVKAMQVARIDDIGLGLQERKILIAVAREGGRPIGLESIAGLTGMRDVSEQVATLTRLDLLRQNIGQRGRIVPAWAYRDVLGYKVIPPMVLGRETDRFNTRT